MKEGKIMMNQVKYENRAILKKYELVKEQFTDLWLLFVYFEDGTKEVYNTNCYSEVNAEKYAKWLIENWKREGLIQ